jgi:hypothetical protein
VLLLALLAAMPACAAERWRPADTVGVDPDMPAEQRAALDRAAARWCDATAGVACLAFRDGTGAPAFVLGHRKNGTAAYLPRYRVVVVDLSRVSFRNWEAVFTHEIGHAYGLPHLSRGLMMGEDSVGADGQRGPWSRRSPKCLDAHTLAEFCARHACPRPVKPECDE